MMGTRTALGRNIGKRRRPRKERARHPSPVEFRYSNEVSTMTLTVSIGPLMALIAGILILLMPRLLNFIVAIYLILLGLLGLFGGGHGLHV
jgi:Protein of unknown function (DUF3096)